MTVMYWLGAAAIFVVIEIITMGLTTIWFAGGALVGAVMAAFSLPLWSQIIAFVIVSDECRQSDRTDSTCNAGH